MSIVEKLGIKQGFCNSVQDQYGMCSAQFVESDEMQQMKDAAPEMLEALIENTHTADVLGEVERVIKNSLLLKRATGKTWEEIKELLQ